MKIAALNSVMFTSRISKSEKSDKTGYVSQTVKPDKVEFSKNMPTRREVKTDLETAKFVANSLSTSTSGHRAPYPSDKFNEDIVTLVTLGVADYAKAEAKKSGKKPTVLIGGDTRQASRESLPIIKDTLLKQGVNVINIEEPVPTPLLAYAAKHYGTDISVLMTASHNPWNDGGYNLVTKAGAIAPASVTQQVAQGIEKYAKLGEYYEASNSKAKVTDVYPYDIYKNQLKSTDLIDWKNIKKANVEVFYDGLNGTGSHVMPRLLSDNKIPFTEVHSSGQEGPNPTKENLVKLSEMVRESKNPLKIGISNDGDADRFGIVDENGKFINADDVILLTGYHLAKNKGKKGAIIRSQATSKQVDEIANMYGLQTIETPVGFKFIGEDIIDLRKDGKDILVAGEESGGLTVNGHIPEKDGIMAASLMLDLVATEKKPISQILKDVKNGLPTNYTLDKFSKKLSSEEDKNIIMARTQQIYDDTMNGKTLFDDAHYIDADKTARHSEEMRKYKKSGDGVKLFFTDGSSVLVRKSGTEPLVKCYIEASGDSIQDAERNKASIRKTMDEVFTL